MRKNRKLVSNSITLLIASLMMITGSLAWFFSMQSAEADNLKFSSIESINSYVQIDDEYLKNIEYEITVEDAKELSGLGYLNGKQLELYYPAKDPFTGIPTVDEDGNWNLEDYTISANTNYVELEISVKSNKNSWVRVAKDTCVLPLDTSARKSGFGNFSEDYIAACTRMSFSELTGEVEDLKAIYAPNKNIELVAPAEGRDKTTGWSIDLESENEQSYSYYDGEKLVTIPQASLNGTLIDSDGDGNGDFYFYDEIDQDGITIGETTLNEDDGCYYYKFVLRVWVEGTDRDTEAALTGGKFNFKLVLNCVEK